VTVKKGEHDEHPFGQVGRIIDSDDLSSPTKMRRK
jgi:hypothetical protein